MATNLVDPGIGLHEQPPAHPIHVEHISQPQTADPDEQEQDDTERDQPQPPSSSPPRTPDDFEEIVQPHSPERSNSPHEQNHCHRGELSGEGSLPIFSNAGTPPSSRRRLSNSLNVPVISSPVTMQLEAKLLDKEKYYAIFIPENDQSIPWRSTPSEYAWKWDNPSRVKLPMSSEWKKKVADNNGRPIIIPRWQVIERQLYHLGDSSCQPGSRVSKLMKEVVGIYNRKLSQICNFRVLDDKVLAQKLPRVLPVIIEYCLRMPYRLGKSIPFLKQGQWRTLFLTRGICASLLANAFLCTIPHDQRDSNKLPHFHFLKLFHDGSEGPRTQVKIEKIKCILEYFEQIGNADKHDLDAIISFERRTISRPQNWSQSTKKLCDVWPNDTHTIEDANDLLQADFANKYVGGGILSVGMVQEEIRFATCPDLIASRLFTEVLGDDDVMVITGARQFSSYTGYRTTFKWQKMESPQNLRRDDLGREMVQLVAMDALFFRKGTESTQYQKHKIDRELHKCSVAFKKGGRVQQVATGNWGCGAFNGDPQLKFIIQWMACTEMDRPAMVYYTVGTPNQHGEISNFVNHVSHKHVTVGKMYRILQKYEKNGRGHWRNPTSVFDFVQKNI